MIIHNLINNLEISPFIRYEFYIENNPYWLNLFGYLSQTILTMQCL